MWLLELRNGSQLQITGKAQTISERDLINVTFATSDIQPNLSPGGGGGVLKFYFGMGVRFARPKIWA